MFETVTPFEGLALVTVTVMLPGEVSLSLTVAINELLTGLPSCLVTATGVIVGAVFVTSSAPMS
jgi:hypothetical protein